MISAPKIGTEWRARDGRMMRVEEIIYPEDPDAMPWCIMTVLNATGSMRKKVRLGVNKFSSDKYRRFLVRVSKPK